LRTKQGKSHLRRKKSKRAKRLYDEMLIVEDSGMRKRVRQLAPYLGKKK
jgi:large subunit ribosomal protein L35